jgi:hypothetical protein
MPGYTTDVNAADEELRAYYSTKRDFLQLMLITKGVSTMWDKIASVLGGGVSEAIDSFKKLAIDSWHVDPAKALELEAKAKELQQAYELKLIEAQTILETMDAADRKSAREREVLTKDHTTKILAYSISAGYFGVLWFMMLYSVPVESQRILDMMLGSLLTSFTGIVAYYFGSSRGSAAKHEMIERLTK